MYAIRKASFGTGTTTSILGFMTSRNLIQQGLAFLGIATAVEFIISLFGDEGDADDIAALMENMMESGFLDVAEKRRGDDNTAVPSIFVFDLSGNLNRGRPFLTWEYFSRNFVNSVRKNERTPRFRGRPRPASGSRRRRS